jgi:hypothetical protein
MTEKDDGYRQPAPEFMASLVPQESLKEKREPVEDPARPKSSSS